MSDRELPVGLHIGIGLSVAELEEVEPYVYPVSGYPEITPRIMARADLAGVRLQGSPDQFRSVAAKLVQIADKAERDRICIAELERWLEVERARQPTEPSNATSSAPKVER